MSENERMIREINKLGGYVYPVEVKLYNGTCSSPGMTLRDYFAGQVINGLMSDGGTQAIVSKLAREADKSPLSYLAVASYEIADAMLEARK